ncbi:MAG TPA: CDF family Co(II)/Ni(II) efflux transporter DmeF [Albitalea sp.]|nr:CDF family Co(II)/Ni(II) efflux transporter DmeF [Albitalea sp.]
MPNHSHDISAWQHSHVFDAGNRRGEARTRVVLAVTLVTMVAEIVVGWWSGSMALLADGWHMGTHALALGVAAAAYALARRHARDTRFSFGTWKIEVLGSFASALVLLLVAVGIVGESAARLWRAEPIAIEFALVVAIIGLVVNLLSAWLLHGAEDHDHDHAHHDHAHHGHDMNLRAAYVHVLADALTSVLAIGALAGALWLGWWWLDPLVGVAGAVVIGVWAIGLLRESSTVLLDREMDTSLTQRIRAALESDGDAVVADLHVWRVGREQFAAIVCIVADAPLAPSAYRDRLAEHRQLVHVSVEVNRCPAAPP